MIKDLNYIFNYIGMNYRVKTIDTFQNCVWLNSGPNQIVFFINHKLHTRLLIEYRLTYNLWTKNIIES